MRLILALFSSFNPTRDGEKTVTNAQTGWMLRTKLSHVDEGGVAAGLGALDSLCLVDAEGCCVNTKCTTEC